MFQQLWCEKEPLAGLPGKLFFRFGFPANVHTPNLLAYGQVIVNRSWRL